MSEDRAMSPDLIDRAALEARLISMAVALHWHPDFLEAIVSIVRAAPRAATEPETVTIDGHVWPWPGNTRLPWQVWNEVPHPDGGHIMDPDGFRGNKPTIVTWAEFDHARMECTLSWDDAAPRAATEPLVASLPLDRGAIRTALHGAFHPGHWLTDCSQPELVEVWLGRFIGHLSVSHGRAAGFSDLSAGDKAEAPTFDKVSALFDTMEPNR